MTDRVITIIMCVCAILYNLGLLLCCTYLTVKFNNFWFMFFILFSRDIHYSSDNKEDKNKEES